MKFNGHDIVNGQISDGGDGLFNLIKATGQIGGVDLAAGIPSISGNRDERQATVFGV